jgi:very-short-patch-repair endonuclease
MDREPDYARWKTPRDTWKKLKPLARDKRHEPTAAEWALCQCVRNRQIEGVKFRRQHPVGPFIVDFYAAEARLIVEVDGPSHDHVQEEDAVRQQFLEDRCFQVLHFRNAEVLETPNAVVEAIRSAIVNSLNND